MDKNLIDDGILVSLDLKKNLNKYNLKEIISGRVGFRSTGHVEAERRRSAVRCKGRLCLQARPVFATRAFL